MDPLYDSPFTDREYQVSRGWPFAALEQAMSGDVHAQLYLASITYSAGTPERRSMCVRWYEMAAEQGNLHAMAMMYHLYAQGDYVGMDIPKACEWMRRIVSMYDTAKNDDQRNMILDVMFLYAWYLLGFSSTDANCSLPENLQDATEGLRWLERAADLGHKDAVDNLGNMYMTGQQPKLGTDIEKGMAWFKKGARLGNAQNAFQLAMAYKSGTVPVNPLLEKQWLMVAARLGSNSAREWLSAPADFRFDAKQVARRQLRHLDKEKNIEQILGTDESDKCYNPPCDRTDAPDARFQSCGKCKSVKYCSRDCQVMHWKNGHKSECQKLQKHKDYFKERVKEENRRSLENLEAEHVEHCCVCKKESDEHTILMRCSKCKVPKYCSTECQVNHWKRGGHKAECAKAVAEFNEAQEILDLLNAQNEPSHDDESIDFHF